MGGLGGGAEPPGLHGGSRVARSRARTAGGDGAGAARLMSLIRAGAARACPSQQSSVAGWRCCRLPPASRLFHAGATAGWAEVQRNTASASGLDCAPPASRSRMPARRTVQPLLSVRAGPRNATLISRPRKARGWAAASRPRINAMSCRRAGSNESGGRLPQQRCCIAEARLHPHLLGLPGLSRLRPRPGAP